MKTELVTTLKRHATRILAELKTSDEPLLITEYGKPSAYLIGVDAYQALMERLQILEGIARGERAILENRLVSHDDARKSLSKWQK
ncbi:MAG: type II toxin-antitoxin system Phd/YefM family antitoxin [Acidobacteria bacterium]|nr:type II toxin-antitoxin system Phd/YefM family antitoxin [Acidobacteriota bacterium]MCB9397707.1 type II toxin-antitoxin system Phd/YefM family antitoxin [Acidobacteriota bacterium]